VSENSTPKGWAIAALGDICVEKVEQREPGDDAVAYIDIGSIDRGTKTIGELQHVTSTDAPTRARQSVRAGDVLVSMTRPNLNAVALVPGHLDGAIASTGFDVLRPMEVLSEWIFNRVRSHDFVADVSENLQGVVYPAIRPHDVRRHQCPIPPLPEQHRIVEAIESYFTRLDDAVATLERVQRNLKRYRASVLKAAVEGRLVPTEAELARAEGRDYEPASALLERILAERRRRWHEAGGRGKYQEPLAPDTTGLPDLPQGWCWARAEQVCEFITKGTTPKNYLMTQEIGDVPYIKVYNLTFDGSLDFSIDPTFVGSETHRGFLARSAVLPGDVLVNIVGPPLGKVSVVPSTYPEWNINQAIARFRPVSGLENRYMALLLGCPFFLAWAKSRSKATAGQFNLTLAICRDAPVPLPPTAEQTRIVNETERALSLADEADLTTGRDLVFSARFRRAILKWAFEGKLADQDPSDEPASALLERIRSQTSASRQSASDADDGRRRRRGRRSSVRAENKS
jgi:type I restriction enzyme S subunit